MIHEGQGQGQIEGQRSKNGIFLRFFQYKHDFNRHRLNIFNPNVTKMVEHIPSNNIIFQPLLETCSCIIRLP